MLTVEESSMLFSLLNAEHRPFGEIMADFVSKFPCFTRRFRICMALATLLEDPPMLRSYQRMVAICLLHQSYASQQPSANPFISVLLDVACDERFETYERGVVSHLLGACCPGTSKEFLAQSAAEYRREFPSREHYFTNRQELEEQYGNKEVVSERYKCLSEGFSVKNIIPDPDIPLQWDASSLDSARSGDRDEAIVQFLQYLSIPGIEPQWVRPHPPRLPVQEGEMVWLIPEGDHELLWDYGMCAGKCREATVTTLIAKALKETLATAQQEQLLRELANDPKVVHHCGLDHWMLPDLVEKNPHIAAQVLIKLKNSPDIQHYYFGLVHMDLSQHSMEVVNRLTIADCLPKVYLNLFIQNCLSSCQKMKDKFKQTKLVRHVCVFLQSLIKRKIINVNDYLDEILAFCFKFSRIREAFGLFNVLKESSKRG